MVSWASGSQSTDFLLGKLIYTVIFAFYLLVPVWIWGTLKQEMGSFQNIAACNFHFLRCGFLLVICLFQIFFTESGAFRGLVCLEY